MNLQHLDPFTRGYITAAMWTEDDDAPGGDYIANGRFAEMEERLDPDFVQQAVADCAKFEREHADLLAKAGTPEQNGHDFWLTRNGHGAGFWDRGYPEEVGDKLTELCDQWGDVYDPVFLEEEP